MYGKVAHETNIKNDFNQLNVLFWQNNFVLIVAFSFDLNFILEHRAHFWKKSLKQAFLFHKCKKALPVNIDNENKLSLRSVCVHFIYVCVYIYIHTQWASISIRREFH